MTVTWQIGDVNTMQDGEEVAPRERRGPREGTTEPAPGELCLVGVLHSVGKKSDFSFKIF